MADITVPPGTYKDLLKAADAAFGKIGSWMKNTINDNKIFVASNKAAAFSLSELDAKIARANALKAVTKDPGRIAKLDGYKAQYQDEKKDIQRRSDTLNRKGWDKAGAKVLNGTVDKLIDDAPKLLQMGMAAQVAQVSFQRLTGSSAAAQEVLKGIHNMAATSLFDNDKLQGNATSLLENGVAAGKLLPTLSMLGDVSGGNQSKMDTLTKAFGDMQSAGHLTSESLKEMNDAGFKPLELLAASSGQTVDELRTQMEAGGISTESVVGALQRATSQGGQFFGVMKDQSETAAGQWHGLKEKMAEAGATVGNALMPTVSDFMENTLKPLVGWLSSAADWMGRNTEWVGFLTTVVATAVIGYKAWTIAAQLLGGAVAGSGIGLAVTIIAALIGVVLYAWNTFGWFRGAVMAAWEILKGFAGLIGDVVIAPIKNLISGIANVGKAIWYLFSGDWDKAWESGKEAIKDLSGYNTLKTVVGDFKDMGGKAADAFNTEMNKKKGDARPGVVKPPPPMSPPGNFAYGGGSSGGAGSSGSYGPPLPGVGGKGKGAGTAGSWDAPGFGYTAPKVPDNFTADGTRRKMTMDNAKDTATGITNGGARTVNITLQKLVETINITTNTVSEGISNMEQQVTDALLHILKSANATA